ncbi:uncharacterized protein LOC111128247 [Crassostrea virginica]
MAKITDCFTLVALVFAFFVCLLEFSDAARDACGTVLGVTFYCPTNYHCCDDGLYTCCPSGYICAGTACISIAAIIVPIIIVVVIIVVVVVIIIKKNNARQGTVINPGQPQASGYPPPGQNPMGPPGYSQNQQPPPPPKY